MRIISGGVKFALYIVGHILTDEEIDAIFEIDGVREVGSEGAQDDKVIFYLPDSETLTQERVNIAKSSIQNILKEQCVN